MSADCFNTRGGIRSQSVALFGLMLRKIFLTSVTFVCVRDKRGTVLTCCDM